MPCVLPASVLISFSVRTPWFRISENKRCSPTFFVDKEHLRLCVKQSVEHLQARQFLTLEELEEAPPPVEMCEKPSSGKPRLRTAEAESPPPTMVNAPAAVASTRPWPRPRCRQRKPEPRTRPSGRSKRRSWNPRSCRGRASGNPADVQTHLVSRNGVGSHDFRSDVLIGLRKTGFTTISVGNTSSTPFCSARSM